MANQTQYEVLSKQNGRWEINNQYHASEEDEAIKEAKSLEELNHIEDVKVIREVFYPEEGISREYNIYQPSKKKYRPPSKFPKKNPIKEKASHEKVLLKNIKRGPSLHNTLINIILVCGFSIFAVAAFTWFASKHITDIFVSILK